MKCLFLEIGVPSKLKKMEEKHFLLFEETNVDLYVSHMRNNLHCYFLENLKKGKI